MEINFTYYTTDPKLLAEAFVVADDCGIDDINVGKSNYNDNPEYHITATGEYSKMPKLMEFFESNDFTNQNENIF